MTEAANSGLCVKVMWLEGLFRYGAFLTFCVQTQCGHKLTLHTQVWERTPVSSLGLSSRRCCNILFYKNKEQMLESSLQKNGSFVLWQSGSFLYSLALRSLIEGKVLSHFDLLAAARSKPWWGTGYFQGCWGFELGSVIGQSLCCCKSVPLACMAPLFAFCKYWPNCCHRFCLLMAISSTWFSTDIW